MEIKVRVADAEFLAGVVVAPRVMVAETPAMLTRRIDELVSRRGGEDFPAPALKEAIRQMLRKGGFKASGRNKPASEYLAQAAREGRFPRINNLVDINNLLSLESGLPISLLDLDAVGNAAEIRYGLEGEKYVFNSGGQEIDLKGLVCVCRADAAAAAGAPLGNPVKDSMAGKIKDHTTGVLGVVYASNRAISESQMGTILGEFSALIQAHAGGSDIAQHVLRG
jgi:DNA/RNA-binding domain of Phe-tRNA-synthetase-like protein